MIITRPYEAEDNEINKEMFNIIMNYLKKNNINPEEIQIYGYCVSAICGNEKYIISKAEGCRAKTHMARNYFYMQIEKEGKRKRIKKEDWL